MSESSLTSEPVAGSLAELEVLGQSGPAARIRLGQPMFRIGRLANNDLTIDDKIVSRYHAVIVCDGTDHVLIDKESRGGSYVNGVAASRKTLVSGDRISLGRADGHQLVFRERPAVTDSMPAGDGSETIVVNILDHQNSRYLRTLDPSEQPLDSAQVPHLKNLFEITSAMLSIRSPEALTEKLLDLVAGVLPAERAFVLLSDSKDEAPRITSLRIPEGMDAKVATPSSTVVRRVHEDNVAILSLDAATDNRFASQESVMVQSIRSVICAPISSVKRVWGVCYLDNSSHDKTFTKEELEFLMAVSRQAGIALEILRREKTARTKLRTAARRNRNLYKETLSKSEALTELMARVHQAHEEERSRISRDLHDGIAQNLAALILHFDYLRRTVAQESAEAEVNRLEEVVKDTVVELRRVISDLKPVVLDRLGLSAAMRKLAQDFRDDGKAEVTLDCVLETVLPAPLELAIYRITQEALNNAGKYSGAASVSVELRMDDDGLELSIEDNGKGFELSETAVASIGLVSMRERAELVGGKVEILSEPGMGTTVRALFPLPAQPSTLTTQPPSVAGQPPAFSRQVI